MQCSCTLWAFCSSINSGCMLIVNLPRVNRVPLLESNRLTNERQFPGSGPMGRVQKYTSTSKYIPGSLYILFVRSAKKKKKEFFGARYIIIEHLLIEIKIRNRNAGPVGISCLGKVRSTLTSV